MNVSVGISSRRTLDIVVGRAPSSYRGREEARKAPRLLSLEALSLLDSNYALLPAEYGGEGHHGNVEGPAI